MSEKHCAKSERHKRLKIIRRVLACLVGVVILVLLAVLIVWLVLRPTHPRFILRDAAVYAFNLSSSNLLTTTVQATLSSYNPNDRIGVYYDRLDAFISYKGQQVTIAAALPPGYQGHHDVDVWSPYLYGAGVPLAPFLAAAVFEDEQAGLLLLYVKLDGRVRWKVGSWMSGGYHITVNCPAFFVLDADKGFKFQQISSCSVEV